MLQKRIIVYLTLLAILTGCAHEPSGNDRQTEIGVKYARAQELLDQEDYDGAIALCKSIIAADGTYQNAYKIFVDAYAYKFKDDSAIMKEAEEYLNNLALKNSYSNEVRYALGDILYRQYKFEEALAVLNETLKYTPSFLEAYRLTGKIYFELGKFAKALEYYEELLSRAEKVEDKKNKLIALVDIGRIYLNFSDYSIALEFYEKALSLARELGNLEIEAHALNNFGMVYQYLSDYPGSLEYYKKALSIFEKIGDRKREGALLGNIANIYINLSDYSGALEYYKKSLTLAREMGDLPGEVRTLGNLGTLYDDTADYENALKCYEQAIPIARKIRNKILEGFVIHNMANVYKKKSDYPKAIENFKIGLSLFQKTGFLRGERFALWALGNVYFALEDFSRALSFYEKAISITEETRSSLQYDRFKTSFLHGETEAYENTISLLYTLDSLNPEQGYDARAFRYAEKSKARGLLDLLAESEADINQTIDPELIQRHARLDEEYARINTGLGQQLALPDEQIDEQQVQALKDELEQLDDQYEMLKLDIIRSNSRYGEVKYFEALTIEEIQETLLDDKTALLEFKVANESLFAWRITKKGSRFFKLDITEEELTQKISSLRNCFTALLEEEFFTERAGELYELLMKPLLEGIEDKEKLLIIPDGILNYLPFEVLISRPVNENNGLSYKDLPYLLKEYSVCYAPSATVAGRKVQQKKEGLKDFFAMGDPVFSTEAGDTDDLKFSNFLASRGRGVFDRLVHSGDEVRNIGKLFKNSLVYTREEATEDNLKTPGILEDFRYVHLAAHGMLNEEEPRNSGIILTQDENPAEDGILLTREIFNLKLNADLVVLSACSTGQGKLVKGEGVVGLSRAWLYAGASSIIVSLWEVDDRSTRYLMEAFYKNIGANMEFSQALRNAKLELMNMSLEDDFAGESFGNPYYWAAFVLTGRM